MKDQKINPGFSAESLFLTFFGIGLIPFAPGTFASLATIPFFWFAGRLDLPKPLFIPIILLFIVGSCLVAEHMQKKLKVHDPSWIVIDEVCGMVVGWLFVESSTWMNLALLCLFFRIFDIWKPWPISYFDKEVKHGAGTILDDVISGVFAGLCFLLVQFLIHLVK